MLPSGSSVPSTDDSNREREGREGEQPTTLATPEGTPGHGIASQGLGAAAQVQQLQGVHNNNSFSLSSSGRTTPAEAAINTPTPPLPVPTGAPTKSTQGGGQTEGGQLNQQQLVRRKLHIDSLQAKVDEAKSAMDEIQNEMDGVSEAVVDDTADTASRAAAKLQLDQLESKYHAEVRRHRDAVESLHRVQTEDGWWQHQSQQQPEGEGHPAHASENPMVIMVDEETGNKYTIPYVFLRRPPV